MEKASTNICFRSCIIILVLCLLSSRLIIRPLSKRPVNWTPTYLGLNPEGGLSKASRFGEDAIIGFLDTGISPEHQCFDDRGLKPIGAKWRGACQTAANCNNKLIGARSFCGGVGVAATSRDDYDHHGTSVASVAACNQVQGVNGTPRGMAPKARVAMYKAYESGECDTNVVGLSAIDQAIKDGVDVLSISLSSSMRLNYEDAVSVGSFAAIQMGIPVVASAGNKGPDPQTVDNTEPWIITVGATTTHGIEPMVAKFSSIGPSLRTPEVLKPDIVAPGSGIFAASSAGPKAFTITSGTSFAAPHVAGIVALLRVTHPSWSPAAIKSALMTTAQNSERLLRNEIDMEPSTPYHFGAGLVNPEAANDPGLVYDANADDYIQLLCSLNYTQEQINRITRGNSSVTTCADYAGLGPGDFNYPSFSFVYKSQDRTETHTRTLTNVADLREPETYIARVVNPASDEYDIRVIPQQLIFSELNQKKSFTVMFETKHNPGPIKVQKRSAYIIWESTTHTVTSPVVMMLLSTH